MVVNVHRAAENNIVAIVDTFDSLRGIRSSPILRRLLLDNFAEQFDSGIELRQCIRSAFRSIPREFIFAITNIARICNVSANIKLDVAS